MGGPKLHHIVDMLARLIGLIVLCAVPLPSHAGDASTSPVKAQGDAAQGTYFPEEAERWIPFTGLEDQQIVIPAWIDGESISALIDTGTPFTAISASWAKSHGAALSAVENSTGLGGREVHLWQTALGSLRFGGYVQKGGVISVMDLDGINAQLPNRRIDMIIGFAALQHFVTEIDFDQVRIRIHMAASSPSRARPVPTELSRDKERLMTSLSLSHRTIGPLMIDTGDSGSLSIYRSVLGADAPHWRVTDLESVGFGGGYTTDYVRLNGISWGGNRLGNVPTTIDGKAIGGSGSGRIGMEMLERYNLFIDGPNGRLLLTPRSRRPSPPVVSNMGIQGDMTDQGWQVTHVMRHSPAQAIGLHDGDRICAVDDQAMTAKSLIPRGRDGSVMHLSLCDGRKIVLKRRNFY
ncbi:retropepsin-like aspartic protease [Novosphingobium terrae]|uniref:retropepsin-like aspartic protease n=1 Tax=Novosphingobium terrae TaxID=2726189 RepID=UPI00197F9B72|nr:aspartyl protease family protein [Novosphingobium terrae]